MTDEYIRKADAIKQCGFGMTSLHIANNLRKMPSADVVPVVHGKWIDEDPAFAEYFANCSVCGYEIDVHNERGYFNFCPNCGAKMDGEE
ncbi:MAG: hypothetical protein U0L88_15220 [Acutalibacteraceae bacterium]|nr:hypothetical protein [Acutalibacteraceae bacterium]